MGRKYAERKRLTREQVKPKPTAPLVVTAPEPQPISHLRMEERALRERWPISVDDRGLIIERLLDIVRGDRGQSFVPPSPREITSAAKALLSADRLNLEEMRIRDQAGSTIDEDVIPLDEETARRIYAVTNDGSDPVFDDQGAPQSTADKPA